MIRIVHIGESTLEKRVSEFAGTDASALTAVEFEEHSKELERDEQLRLENIGTAAALAGPLPTPEHGCEHIGKPQVHSCATFLLSSSCSTGHQGENFRHTRPSYCNSGSYNLEDILLVLP